VPWQSDTRLLYYRKELTDDPNKLQTFAGFVQCLHSQHQQTGSPPFGVGLNRKRDAWDVLHNTLAYFFNGQILEKRYWQWRPVFCRGEPCKGLKDFWSLTQEGLVYFIDERENIEGLAEGLLEDRYDAVFGGPHLRSVFESDPNIQAAPLPELIPGRKFAFLGGCHLGVSRATHKRGNERDAHALVKFLSSREAQGALFRNTGALPARRDAIGQFIAENPRWKAIGETLEYAKPYPSIPRWAKGVERDVVLDHFYAILKSIQKREEWPVIEKQLEAAARELQPPFPWLAFSLGFSVIGISTALIVVVIIYRIKTKDELADSLADITVTIKVTSFEPPEIELQFSRSHQKFALKRISGLTAALLLQGMRNKYVYIPELLLYHDLYRGGLLVIPTRDNARKSLHFERTRLLIQAIEGAIGHELNLGGKHDREVFLFRWELQERRYVCEIDKQQYIKSAIMETREDWIAYEATLKLPETVELIKKDPGRVAAWHKLADLLAQSNCSDEYLHCVRRKLEAQIEILNKMLLRYMGTKYGLTGYIMGYAGVEVDEDWAAKEGEQIKVAILTPTEELYKMFALLNRYRGMPESLEGWAAKNIHAYKVGHVRNLISDSDDLYSRSICILAIAQHLLDKPGSADEYESVVVQGKSDNFALRLRDRLAFGKEVFLGMRELWITISQKCAGRPI